jgi:hypothetical protein
MKSERRGAAPQASPELDDVPALPVGKAFVVQFSRETRAQSGPFEGRLEHMRSGRRAHFASAPQLVAALRTLLARLGDHGV